MGTFKNSFSEWRHNRKHLANMSSLLSPDIVTNHILLHCSLFQNKCLLFPQLPLGSESWDDSAAVPDGTDHHTPQR